MTDSRWFAFAIVFSMIASLALAASCGDDDDDDDDDTGYDDDTGDDDTGDDDAGDDDSGGGDCNTVDLCGPISECGFGFTQDECEESYLSFCSSDGDVDSFLTCMCDFIDAYNEDGDCTAFSDAEASCWEVAGC
ncbi:MAG: hypothetical protein KJ042_13335 [Deltaproteobacteria bacterium]|nr:hypothetical protein [Deltaproteobacteria bacterium]